LKILAIETSCDETSAAVVEDGVKILSNVVASQTDLHQRFGGVVPEVASRRHVELILPTVDEALTNAQIKLADVDSIGVINRPGLIGALIVGAAAAKSIAFAAGIPIVPVHHLEAHIHANWLVHDRIEFPALCLVVSGGHSDLILMSDHGSYQTLARTRDDAAGETFDKCARAMGLGYPGGPLIDKLSKQGNPGAIDFPRGRVKDSLDFSFSGLKTAVIRFVQAADAGVRMENVAAGLQEAVVDVLVDHTLRAARETGVRQVLLAGGVAANSRLQERMKSEGELAGLSVLAPPPSLCTDNAAMAGSAAYFAYQRGEVGSMSMDCFASEPLGTRT
jgi:N6-L-threonylcarbamoyladenine synthase